MDALTGNLKHTRKTCFKYMATPNGGQNSRHENKKKLLVELEEQPWLIQPL
jgi:hypothetical protein